METEYAARDCINDALRYVARPRRQGKTDWLSTRPSYFSHPWLIQKEEQAMSNKVYVWSEGFLEVPKTKATKQPPKPKYATVEIERKAVGFLVTASRHATMAQNDDYEGAVSTYAEASKLAGKLMKEMV